MALLSVAECAHLLAVPGGGSSNGASAQDAVARQRRFIGRSVAQGARPAVLELNSDTLPGPSLTTEGLVSHLVPQPNQELE